MRELNDAEFHATFIGKMTPIDFDSSLLNIELELENIELSRPGGAYRNGDNTYEHHMINTHIEHIFLVFVKNLKDNQMDYHILDLNEKYGIDASTLRD